MRALIVLALLAVGPAERPPDGCAYPAEVSTFRLCSSAPWRILRPLASTAAEVRAALGTPTDARDIAAYLDPYPGDDRAKQPVLTFDGGPDWEILVYFVRSGLADQREYPEAFHDKLLSIDLVPRHRVPMGQITFPPGFEKQHVVAADAAWDLYRHPSGLSYEVYTTRTPYGGHQPGDLNRISYGPSDEARLRAAVRRPSGGEGRDGGGKTRREFTLTADHLRLLRQLRMAWAPVEAGGPMIDGEMAFGSVEVERDVARILGHPGTRSEPDYGLPEGLVQAVAVLLDNGKLQPGTYEIWNGERARITSGGKLEIGDSVALEIPASPTLRFEVTPDHLKLFAHANFNEIGVDFKRPYGDRTYYWADIADALGVAVPRAADGSLGHFQPEQIARFDKLHGEMLFTFQAFLEYAQLEPGVFVRRDGRWTRQDTSQGGNKPASR